MPGCAHFRSARRASFRRRSPTTSRRRKDKGHASSPQVAAAPSAIAPIDLLRRTLLVLVTALIVARPLVLGEDPGLSSPQSDTGSMVLSLLWLVAGVGWAAWRLWARRGEWYVGVVEAGLGFAVVFFMIGAQFAANRHPARIIAWEWLVLLVGFVVLRHLAATADVRNGLFAAFLATGVMIAAYAIYQEVHELPDEFGGLTKEQVRAAFATQGMTYDDPTFEVLYSRVRDKHAFSTFSHPNSCAGYLALLLPGLVGAVVVSLRSGTGIRLTRFAVLAAMIGAGGLWVTHSRGAILALLVVGIGVAAVCWRRQLLERKALALGTVAAAAVAAFVVFKSGFLSSGFGKDTGTMAARLDYWRATVKMIAAKPWLGVGPGNFGGWYPRFMAETAGEKIKDPHNFVLELWATGGIFVLLAVLGALAAFLVIVVRGLRAGDGDAKPEAADETVRWEYYVGGVLGLLIGFSLRLSAINSANDILKEGLTAAARTIVWFGAFALFERIRWTDRQRVVALTAGIVACLLNLGVSGGISAPSVAGPLWLAIALTLASLPLAPRVFAGAPLPSLGLPIPILGAIAVLYLVYCFYPVSTSLTLLRLAENNSQVLRSERIVVPSVCATSVGLYASGNYGTNLLAAGILRGYSRSLNEYGARAPIYLEESVLAPLREAAGTDPDNPRVWTQLGIWYGKHWEFSHDQERSRVLIGGAFHNAQLLDPNGIEPLQAEMQLRRNFAYYSRVQAEGAHRAREAGKPDPKLSPADWKKRQNALEDMEKQSLTWVKEHYENAIDDLRKAVKIDPTDSRLHYQLAELLNEAGDREGCRSEAQEALRLHGVSTMPTRRLADRQRQLAEGWAAAPEER